MHDVVWCLLPLTSFLVWYFFLWKTQCGKCDERGSSVGLLRIPRGLSHQCVCSHWDLHRPGEGWVWTRVPQQHVPPTGGRSGHAEWRCWHRAGRNELLRLTGSRLARTGHMANVFSPLTQNKTKRENVLWSPGVTVVPKVEQCVIWENVCWLYWWFTVKLWRIQAASSCSSMLALLARGSCSTHIKVKDLET